MQCTWFSKCSTLHLEHSVGTLVVLMAMFPPASPSPSLFWPAAHTGSLTPECLVNDHVDRMASSAQQSNEVLPSSPLVTFAIDDYTIFAPGYGLIECNLSSFVAFQLKGAYALNDSFHPAKAFCMAVITCPTLLHTSV
ncbi:uncharacterized protein BJ212DRAFT_931549 [Suillus subaureus]|uniref:Uncharacterized protein n=1 Tax=Suillus subaureus TaxID=48587 RepID=A0A9P7EI42_9AGAM|nr:uncharacterized protein BJ212DRAFT_931549 [Suillus subaureus]KAG1821939.1 hypothetical protein BJ212DRAFT_931549 [Suillus subaureus]